MARLKGSKNKAKETVSVVESNFDKDFKEKGYGITPNKGIFCVNADKFNEFPNDWFSMSKTDKLKWLTANRK